jgi:hypothetical protein
MGSEHSSCKWTCNCWWESGPLAANLVATSFCSCYSCKRTCNYDIAGVGIFQLQVDSQMCPSCKFGCN